MSILKKAWGRFELLISFDMYSKHEENRKYRAHALRFTIKCLPFRSDRFFSALQKMLPNAENLKKINPENLDRSEILVRFELDSS